ncbi:MAG TPA: signal peptidase II [Candidatus Acidoferrales bacterium]|nr:signal peptidase II [Candidatus Acidoferrales bacterium]
MKKYLFVCLIAAVVLGLDQLTKWYIRKTLGLYESLPVVDSFFEITHVSNTGGAFGLFAGAHSSWRLPFLLVMSTVAVSALLYFVRRVPEGHWILLLALGGILGGALGNFADRIIAGKVTDFLYFHWREYSWPAFNVADSFISVGMVTLLLHSFLVGDEQPDSKA